MKLLYPLISAMTHANVLNQEQHWNLIRYCLFWAHESYKEPADSCRGFNCTTYSCVWMMVKGSCVVNQGGAIHHLKEGQSLLLSPGLRDQSFAEGTRILSVGFFARWPHGIDLVDAGKGVLLDHPEMDELKRRARQLVAIIERTINHPCNWSEAQTWPNALSVDTHFELNGIFMAWMAQLIRIAEECGATIERLATRDPRVDSAIKSFMHAPMPSTLKTVAKTVGVSRRRLDELFKRDTGLSAAAYAEEVMLGRLMQDLCNHDYQIAEIAYRYGFNHLSSFSRWFRHKTGMSTSDYRTSRAFTANDGVAPTV